MIGMVSSIFLWTAHIISSKAPFQFRKNKFIVIQNSGLFVILVLKNTNMSTVTEFAAYAILPVML